MLRVSGLVFRIFGNWVKNTMLVMVTASTSATGSAKKTANTLSFKNSGRIKIIGMSRMIFRNRARNRDTFACPKATKVCWQAN